MRFASVVATEFMKLRRSKVTWMTFAAYAFMATMALYQRQAQLAAAKGDNEGRLQALKKALETDRKSVAIASEVADLAEAAGDDELAMRALRVVTANPVKDPKGSAVAYYRLGRIAHKSRDKARAIIFVKRALQEDPELAEAKALLDELK